MQAGVSVLQPKALTCLGGNTNPAHIIKSLCVVRLQIYCTIPPTPTPISLLVFAFSRPDSQLTTAANNIHLNTAVSSSEGNSLHRTTFTSHSLVLLVIPLTQLSPTPLLLHQTLSLSWKPQARPPSYPRPQSSPRGETDSQLYSQNLSHKHAQTTHYCVYFSPTCI